MSYRRALRAVLALLVVLSTFFPLLPVPSADAADPPVDPFASCGPATSAIACENSKAGSPLIEWMISGAGDTSIQGFATDISVDRGASAAEDRTVRFKVQSDSSDYRLDIYRMGYYAGNGARLIATVQPSATLPQSQPACLSEPATGLIDCGNWAVSASWPVPGNATSGIYFARLVREDAIPGSSHVFFVVRDDASTADLLFQTADTTWQAYNFYGGKSLYDNLPTGSARAHKVSYNRPFLTRNGQENNWVFNAEYPMVRWLEANGYDVAYTTGLDVDRGGSAPLKRHKAFLSVGHDEYWSGSQRANVEAAREAGVHLAFFAGNEVYWKTRWEPSIDGSETAYRTLVSYKETHANADIDPTAAWTGTWRDPRFAGLSTSVGAGRPENSLTGTIFTVQGTQGSILVPAEEGKLRLWRDTSVANLPPGQVAALGTDTLGFEWNEDLDNGARPPGLVRMSSSTFNVGQKLLDYGNTVGPGPATHSLTLYRAASGALVFGAGTIQWPWGLDGDHDRGTTSPDLRMQQATVNLFADMGAQPTTRQAGLVAATASTDATAPISTITSPAAGASLPNGTAVTITGTATDAGGVVGGVEVSTDDGATWHPATGRGSWSYSWTPTAPGPTTIKTRAVDDSGNLEAPGIGLAVTITARSCPCSLWNDSETPTIPTIDDRNGIELGLRFSVNAPGQATGARFYKGPTNAGTHIGHLWDNNGTKLAEVTFTNESASGWQTAMFAAPVPLTPGTTYVVSYYAPIGQYAGDSYYFANSGRSNTPLLAPKHQVDPANGINNPQGSYVYTTSPQGGFPALEYQATNYWVDVVVTIDGAPDTAAPVISNPQATAITPTGATIGWTTDEASDTQVEYGTTTAYGSSTPLAPAVVTNHSQTLTGLASNTLYHYRVKSKDAAGNLATSADFTFTTTAPDAAAPVISAVQATTVTFSGATITWTTDEPAESRVEYGPTTAYGSSTIANVSLVTGHSQPLSGLTPGTLYHYRVKSRDAAGNEAVSADFTFITQSCPCSVLGDAQPQSPSLGSGGPVQLGLKFQANTDGYVTGIRFYKAAGDAGAHVGTLWSSAGAPLASAAFASESASGWQQVSLPTPVPVAAGTTYVVSYHSSNGTYLANGGYFGSAVQSGPLTAPSSGSVGGNGVFVYGTSSAFPTESFGAANYWADVVFVRGPSAPSMPDLNALSDSGSSSTDNITNNDRPLLGGTAAANTTVELLDGATSLGTTPVDPNGVWSFRPAIRLAEGVHSLTGRVRDAAGNVSPSSAPLILTIDMTPPIATATSLQGWFTSSPVSVTITARDTLGLSSIHYNLDGVQVISPASGELAEVTFTVDGQGEHALTYFAFDLAGNATISGASGDDVRIDSVPPTGSVSVNAGATSTASAAVTLTLSASDATSGVGEMAFSSNGTDWTAWEPYANAKAYTLSSGDGLKTVHARFRDLAGNVTSAAISDQITLDTVAPATTITVQPAELTNRTEARFEFVGEQDSALRCRLDGGTFTPCASPTTYTGLADGSHTFTIEATDPAGNAATTAYTWTVDTGAPETTIASGPSSPTRATSATFAFSGSQSGGTLECQLNGGAFAACSSPATYGGLADGGHTFRVRAIDPAGNADPSPASYAWTVDTTAPAVSVPADMTVEATGPGGGAATYSAAASDLVSGPLTPTCAPAAGSTFPLGATTVTCTAADAAGNSASAAFAVTVRDTTGPAISGAPNSQTLEATGPGGAAATWTAPTAADLVDGARPVTCAPAAGSTFPLGTTTVTCSSSDSRGNTSTATFAVTVRDTTAPTGGVSVNAGAPYTSAVDVTLTLTATDVASGVSEVSFSDDGTSWTTWEAFATARSYTLPVGDGAKTVHARLRDAAGNVSPAVSDGVVLDTTAPSGSISVTAVDASGTTATLSLAATDATSGVARMRFSNDGATWSAWEPYATTRTYTLPAGVGAKTIYVQFQDAAGNTSPAVSHTIAGNPTPPPAIGAIQAISITDAGATITWTTDRASDTQVEYGTTTSYGSTTALDPAMVTAHSRTLGGLTASTLYHFRVKSRDAAGSLATSADFTFTTNVAGCPCSIWPTSPTPAIVDEPDSNPVELGVRFRSSVGGRITGLRFYKSAANTGTHVGHIWTASGALLGSATFTSETASGWQQVSFAEPVTIAANTTYVASYYAPNGHYSETEYHFEGASWSNGPLQALADAAESPNGIYRYGTGGGFPTFPWRSTNYWVDVVFDGSAGTTPDTTVTGGATSPTNSADATFSFTSTVAGSTFQCQLDGAGFSACSSPATYGGLGQGSHTFQVRAVDPTGSADPSPASYAWTVDTTAPVLTGLRAGSIRSNSANIIWSTDELSDSQVEYGTTIAYGTLSAPDPDPVTSHILRIRSLKPSTTYQYRARSKDAAGNLGLSANGTFTTPAQQTIGDFQVSPGFPLLDGQNPVGVIDWGKDAWRFVPPRGSFTSDSVTFRDATMTSGTFTFLSPRRLMEVDAYNSGSGPSTITVSCAVPSTMQPAPVKRMTGKVAITDGHPPVQVTVLSGQRVTIQTNWIEDCTAVTFSSTNGWETSFDYFDHDNAWTADTTPPTIGATISGTQGANGWYTSDVSVSWSVADPESGVATSTACFPTTLTADTAGTTQLCSATNGLEVSSSTSRTIKIDKTAPDTSLTVSPSGTSATLSFTSNEAGSTFQCSLDGAAFAACTGPATLSGLGVGSHAVQVRAIDPAGNSDDTPASHTWTVQAPSADTTPPAISASATRNGSSTAFVSGGWASSVTVTFACTDAGSGVGSVTAPITVSAAGANQSATGTCADNAGNTATTTFTGINIDTTAPTASITTPANGAVYLLNQVPAPTAIYSCADGGGSGLESCTAPVPNGGSLSTSSVGANKLTVTATDRAGNTASKTNTYTVVYRVGGWNSDVVWRAAPGYGVPLTVQLTDIVGSNRSASAVTVTESRLVQLNTTAKGSTTSQVASTAPAELDRRFNWDAANKRYTHTVKTDGLATGTWRLYFTTSDSPGFEYYVDFKVKAS